MRSSNGIGIGSFICFLFSSRQTLAHVINCDYINYMHCLVTTPLCQQIALEIHKVEVFSHGLG